MNENAISAAAKAVVRRNTEEVQGKGNFDVFEELFADDFVDHTTQPGTSQTKQACESSTCTFVRLSLISTLRSIGSSRMAIA